MGANRGMRGNGGQRPLQKSNTISFPEKHFRSPVDVINAVIKELRQAQVDIEKVSFFEEPLEAVVQIKKASPPKRKPTWFKKMARFRKKQRPPTFLKLSVLQSSSHSKPFQLRYEIVSTGM